MNVFNCTPDAVPMFFIAQRGRFARCSADDNGIRAIVNLKINQLLQSFKVYRTILQHWCDDGNASSGKNRIFHGGNAPFKLVRILKMENQSYDWFLREGLHEVFRDVAAISDYTGNLELSFLDYSLDEKPKYTIEECKERDATYAKPIKVRVRLLNKFSDVEAILKYTKQNRTDIQKLNKKMEKSYQKLGIVKYDAFNEMGGKLSFALAMLDNNNTGWIINAMHSREGCYTYVKEIVKGESYVELAEEEAEALDKAIFEDGYEEEVDKAVASATGSLKSVKSGPAKNGNQKSTNARNTKQTSGKANNGKILNARTSNVRPDMARPEKKRNER